MRSNLLFIAILACGLLTADLVAEDNRPNLILIMADDLGYETLGANGGTSYKTPQLDRLAASGTRFTHCYVQPLCTPTRVQLMSGQYNIRNYVRFGFLKPGTVTFANLLRDHGYQTGIAGKWQLGQAVDLPKQFGFDEACLWQHTRRPPRYANPGLEYNGVEKDFKNGEYGPDLVNDFAIDFVTRHRDGPFLLYYPMMLTHGPYLPTPDSKDWDPKAEGEPGDKNPEHFRDMVQYMDKLIGKLIATLDELKIRDNTMIIFVGDNGTGAGTKSQMGDRTVIGGKGSTTIAGMHVPLIVNWPEHVKSGAVCDALVDSTDFLPTLLEAAGVKVDQTFDGHSFYRQAIGADAAPRDWVYSWYSPRQNDDKTVREFAFTQRYKLYRSGKFYDLENDPQEKDAIEEAALTNEARDAKKLLIGALAQFKGARPAELDEGVPAEDAKRPRNRKKQSN